MDARAWIDLGIGAATIAGAAATNVWTGGRTRGAVEEKMSGVVKELARLDQVDRDQWGRINEQQKDIGHLGNEIAELRGAQKVKANGVGKGL